MGSGRLVLCDLFGFFLCFEFELVASPFLFDVRVLTNLLLNPQGLAVFVGGGQHGPMGIDAERFQFRADLS